MAERDPNKPLPVELARKLSGFCNPSWKIGTAQGDRSHAACGKDDCPCPCGHKPVNPFEAALEAVS